MGWWDPRLFRETGRASSKDQARRPSVGRLALMLAGVVMVGYVVLAVLLDVPAVRNIGGRDHWPGQGFVIVAAVAVVALACLVDAVLDGRARRRQ